MTRRDSCPAVCQREPLVLLIEGPASAAIYIAMPLSKINYAVLCYIQIVLLD